MITGPHRMRGFSLIEIITAIAIVATLAILLFGVAGRISMNSRNVKCLSNLRTTAAAALSYFTDRNGLFFESQTWYAYPSWGPNGWVGMRDYLGITSTEFDIHAPEFKHDSVLTCPEMKRLHPKAYPRYLNMGLAMNYFLNANDPAPSHSWPNRPPLPGSPRRLQNVPKLSAMWMFTECAGYRVGRGGELFSDIGLNSESYMYFPHNGKQNVIFMDGHVEALTLKQWSTPQSPRNFWGNLLAQD